MKNKPSSWGESSDSPSERGSSDRVGVGGLNLVGVAVVVLIVAVASDSARAQCEASKLGSEGGGSDVFGWDISVLGDLAVVGAPGDHGQFPSQYAVVFRRTGRLWLEDQKLSASDGADGDFFGRSVALSGEVAVIGANRNNNSNGMAGAAYVFRHVRRHWVEEQKLLASNGATDDHFGFSIAFFGSTILVGAFGSNSQTGSAYVYQFDGFDWVETQNLHASDGDAGDQFGRAVDQYSGAAVIGAYGDDDNGFNSG